MHARDDFLALAQDILLFRGRKDALELVVFGEHSVHHRKRIDASQRANDDLVGVLGQLARGVDF